MVKQYQQQTVEEIFQYKRKVSFIISMLSDFAVGTEQQY